MYCLLCKLFSAFLEYLIFVKSRFLVYLAELLPVSLHYMRTFYNSTCYQRQWRKGNYVNKALLLPDEKYIIGHHVAVTPRYWSLM